MRLRLFCLAGTAEEGREGNRRLKFRFAKLGPEKIAAILLIAAVCVGAVFTSVSGYRSSHLSEKQLTQFRETIDLPRNFMLVAAAGCCGKTANTFESFHAGYKNGSGCMEVNVAFRNDGVPVLARGAAFVTDRSDTLESVLKFVGKKTHLKLLLNLKEFTDLDAVAQLILSYGLADNVYVSDVDADSAVYAVEKLPGCKVVLSVPDGVDLGDDGVCAALVEGALQTGSSGFRLETDAYTEVFGTLLREKGLLCILTGGDGKYELFKALSLNPNGIVTQRPDTLYDIMYTEDLFQADKTHQRTADDLQAADGQ